MRVFFTQTIAHTKNKLYLCSANSKLEPWRKDQRVGIEYYV